MSADYSKLDAKIIATIQDLTACRFATIMAHAVAEAAEHSMDEAFRVVDRRLQSLRKRGLIEFTGIRWRMVQK